MAVDLLQLGQHLGQLDARITAIENFIYSGASIGGASSPATPEAPADDGDVEIPGFGSMRALFEGQMKANGGAEGIVARAMAMATQPPPAPPATTPPAAPATTTPATTPAATTT